MSKKQRKEKTTDPITKRLDVLIRLFIEMNKEKFSKTTAVHILKSLELTLTEITKILGKNR